MGRPEKCLRLFSRKKFTALCIARGEDPAACGVRVTVGKRNSAAGEQLIDFEPQIGFAVRQLSAEDLVDLVDQRILFESIALKRCMQTADVEWQAEVLAAHHRLARTPMIDTDGDGGGPATLSAQWIARHDDFHSVVLKGCGSPRLFRAIRQMARKAEIYHRALLPVMSRDEEMDEEHASLVAAIIDGDVDKALALLAQHQLKTRDPMLALLSEAEERH